MRRWNKPEPPGSIVCSGHAGIQPNTWEPKGRSSFQQRERHHAHSMPGQNHGNPGRSLGPLRKVPASKRNKQVH